MRHFCVIFDLPVQVVILDQELDPYLRSGYDAARVLNLFTSNAFQNAFGFMGRGGFRLRNTPIDPD
jgi:hypothetical protein